MQPCANERRVATVTIVEVLDAATPKRFACYVHEAGRRPFRFGAFESADRALGVARYVVETV